MGNLLDDKQAGRRIGRTEQNSFPPKFSTITNPTCRSLLGVRRTQLIFMTVVIIYFNSFFNCREVVRCRKNCFCLQFEYSSSCRDVFWLICYRILQISKSIYRSRRMTPICEVMIHQKNLPEMRRQHFWDFSNFLNGSSASEFSSCVLGEWFEQQISSHISLHQEKKLNTR